MKKPKKIFKKIISLIITIFSLLIFTSCSSQKAEKPPIQNIAVQHIIEKIDLYSKNIIFSDFAISIVTETSPSIDEPYDVLRLEDEETVYTFKVGLESILYKIDDNVSVDMRKLKALDEPLSLDDKDYTIYVCLSAPEYNKKEYGYDPFNQYKPNFKDFLITYDDEELDDKRIKKYISAEELQAILKKGLELEQKLVDMYNSQKLNQIPSHFWWMGIF
ncbi:MAG: hypothetical protein RR697_03505 [Malacoplasma sp.]